MSPQTLCYVLIISFNAYQHPRGRDFYSHCRDEEVKGGNNPAVLLGISLLL